MKTHATLFLLIGISFFCQGQTEQLEIPQEVVEEVNRLTFDHNLHFNPSYVLSHMTIEPIKGPVKKEKRLYWEDYKMIVEFDEDGNPTRYETSKGDSVIQWSTYEYESNKLIRERGRHEVEYIHNGGSTLGVLKSQDRKKSYNSSKQYRERRKCQARKSWSSMTRRPICNR